MAELGAERIIEAERDDVARVRALCGAGVPDEPVPGEFATRGGTDTRGTATATGTAITTPFTMPFTMLGTPTGMMRGTTGCASEPSIT